MTPTLDQAVLVAAIAILALAHGALTLLREPPDGVRGVRNALGRVRRSSVQVCLPLGFALAHLLVAGGWLKPVTAWEMQPLWMVAAVAIAAAIHGALGRMPVLPLALIAFTGIVAVPGAAAEWGAERLGASALAGIFLAHGASARLAVAAAGPEWLVIAERATVLAVTAALAWLSGYATYAILAGILAAQCLPSLVATIVRPSRRFDSGSREVLHALFVALACGAWLHTTEAQRAPLVSFLVLALASAIARAAAAAIAGRGSPRAAWIRAPLLAVLLAAALVLAFLAGAGDDPAAGEPYDLDW